MSTGHYGLRLGVDHSIHRIRIAATDDTSAILTREIGAPLLDHAMIPGRFVLSVGDDSLHTAPINALATLIAQWLGLIDQRYHGTAMLTFYDDTRVTGIAEHQLAVIETIARRFATDIGAPDYRPLRLALRTVILPGA